MACMEDVLDQYERPYDPKYPQVCFDEGLKQLIEETRTGYPGKPGRKERYDYEYKRNGVRNLLMVYEPLAGKRYVQITERQTKLDFAECMKWLVDVLYPDAILIRIVLDNLRSVPAPRSSPDSQEAGISLHAQTW